MSMFKDFMNFSNKEKNGLLIWASLIILLLFSTKFITLSKNNEQVDFQSFENQIESLKKQIKISYKQVSKSYNSKQKLSPEFFNPNTVSNNELQSMGFSEKQIQNIGNYRNKGGRFYQKEDFKKLYLISDEEYAVLEAFLQFDYKKEKKRRPYHKTNLKPFDYNPNEIDKTQMQQLGLNEKQISNIENYRNRGGVFYKKEDFKKLYLISDDEYEVLESFIQFEKNDIAKDVSEKQLEIYDNETFICIEINNASEEDLQAIKGIGPGFAKRITKYKELLGGYYEKEQLLEVYDLDEEIFLQIENQVEVNPAAIQKIRINAAEFNELLKHPYFGYDLVKAIFNYRNKNGPFDRIEDMKNIELIDDGTYQVIKHYIDVE